MLGLPTCTVPARLACAPRLCVALWPPGRLVRNLRGGVHNGALTPGVRDVQESVTPGVRDVQESVTRRCVIPPPVVTAFQPPNVAGTWYPTAMAPNGRDAQNKPKPKTRFCQKIDSSQNRTRGRPGPPIPAPTQQKPKSHSDEAKPKSQKSQKPKSQKAKSQFAKSQKPKAKSQKPKAKSQKPKTKNQKARRPKKPKKPEAQKAKKARKPERQKARKPKADCQKAKKPKSQMPKSKSQKSQKTKSDKRPKPLPCHSCQRHKKTPLPLPVGLVAFAKNQLPKSQKVKSQKPKNAKSQEPKAKSQKPKSQATPAKTPLPVGLVEPRLGS